MANGTGRKLNPARKPAASKNKKNGSKVSRAYKPPNKSNGRPVGVCGLVKINNGWERDRLAIAERVPTQNKRVEKMAIYLTHGKRLSRATLANYGEKSPNGWSGSYKEAVSECKKLKKQGFDCTIKKIDCPKDKKALLDLLNKYAK